jgi:hypothetical protein
MDMFLVKSVMDGLALSELYFVSLILIICKNLKQLEGEEIQLQQFENLSQRKIQKSSSSTPLERETCRLESRIPKWHFVNTNELRKFLKITHSKSSI